MFALRRSIESNPSLRESQANLLAGLTAGVIVLPQHVLYLCEQVEERLPSGSKLFPEVAWAHKERPSFNLNAMAKHR